MLLVKAKRKSKKIEKKNKAEKNNKDTEKEHKAGDETSTTAII